MGKNIIIKPKSIPVRDFQKIEGTTNMFILGSSFDNEYKLFERQFDSTFIFSSKYHPLSLTRFIKLICILLTTQFDKCIYLKNSDQKEKNIKGKVFQFISRAKEKWVFDLRTDTKYQVKHYSLRHYILEAIRFVYLFFSFLFKVIYFIFVIRKFNLKNQK